MTKAAMTKAPTTKAPTTGAPMTGAPMAKMPPAAPADPGFAGQSGAGPLLDRLLRWWRTRRLLVAVGPRGGRPLMPPAPVPQVSAPAVPVPRVPALDLLVCREPARERAPRVGAAARVRPFVLIGRLRAVDA
ncbi:hypothetical protein UA75_09985 [Actinoalloteichus sp. GBA129-24]|uniref:Uncharacterized protein n=1 Tax=Actinoalloteichus fjordicus TaxID=1612552 RepID=A0AAC9LCW4_9PSEU|nr:hypothetical protein UA74_10010 [Actinoalloteichus fjordicus]APU20012.1 hypothetical protein UA75_09985 [Actinoalloteichus sp. GBA129-24]